METGIGGSVCWICSKSTDNGDPAISKKDQFRFLTLIVRHFSAHNALVSEENHTWCRNVCKAFSEATINGEDNGLFPENLTICGKCEMITRKFSDLATQMKEAELRMDWEFGLLRAVMERADDEVPRSKNDVSEINENGRGINFDELRSILRLSCNAYEEARKKMTVPKLRLVKACADVQTDLVRNVKQIVPLENQIELVLDGPRTDFEIHWLSNGILEVHPMPEEGFQQQNSQNGEAHHFDIEYPACSSNSQVVYRSLSLVPSSPSPAFAPLPSQEEDPQNPLKNSQSIYNCTTPSCNIPFTSKFELFIHNMAYHIEKYFSSVQRVGVTSGRFSDITNQLLDSTLDKFDSVDGWNFKCPLCSETLIGLEKARNHLVVKHRPILKQKLLDLQKSEIGPAQSTEEIGRSDADAEPSVTIADPPVPISKKRISRQMDRHLKNIFCSLCSVSLSSSTTMRRHNINVHPEKFFACKELEALTTNQIQNLVAHVLKTFIDECRRVGTKYECIFCPQLKSTKTCIRYHLFVSHLPHLKDKMIELQKSNDICKIINTSKQTSYGRNLARRRRKTLDHKCNTCGMEFGTSSNLKRHQIYFHSEELFQSSNILPSSSTGTNEKFKTYVEYILETQVEIAVTENGRRVTCNICSKLLHDKYLARFHLLSRHKIYIAEKIQEEQQNGKSFQEIVDNLRAIKEANRANIGRPGGNTQKSENDRNMD